MPALFSVTLFTGSALLFLVQPMVAKMILPGYGGSPAVWITSMLFFQAVLLAGYAYAHASTRVMGVRTQAAVHVLLVLAALILLPIVVPHGFSPSGGAHPSLAILGLLALMIGLPFFILSAGAPLLQMWFASTDHPDAHDPYFLYRSSNLGSILALLAYPVLVEPTLRLADQSRVWAYAYGALIALMAASAVAMWRSRARPRPAPPAAADVPGAEPTNALRLRWVALAFVPSSLLLGVTTYLTTNLAPMPLLWVIPLTIYLATFIAAFARKPAFSSARLGRILPLVAAPLAVALVLESHDPVLLLGALHLFLFVVAALMCHTEIAESRPDARHLTELYLWIAVGGVLGGVFNALVAPVAFDTLAEYPLAIVLVCLLRPRAGDSSGRRWLDFAYPAAVGLIAAGAVLYSRSAGIPPGWMRILLTVGIPAVLCFLAADRPIRFGLSLGALFLASSLMQTGVEGGIILAERSFFGVHRVLESEGGRFRTLTHGVTVHGKQDTDLPGVPLAYYHPTGPIGQVFGDFLGGKTESEVALVGLGVGSLAAYGESGRRFTFYEIDPVVVRIAADPRYFTFLADSRADVRIVLGDARLTLAREQAQRFNLIVLDAFSSDAIPVHLLTREAVELYLTKLKDDGLLAFHISNRYLDLKPVLGDIAAGLGLSCVFKEDAVLLEEEIEGGKLPSKWLLMARKPESLGGFLKKGLWEAVTARHQPRVWTDDFSNVLGAFRP